MQQYVFHSASGKRYVPFLVALVIMTLLSACGSRVVSVRFKVNSAPEGAYVLYQIQATGAECAGKWIYIGNTPLQGMYQFNRDQLRKNDKIALRVMQQGYMDQTKEWVGSSFYEEAKGKGVIFWTPDMIPAGVK
ncbi:MAG: hypothetical protein HQQ73_02980 [Desulfobulbaceae bacterium]|nr:hypothetical protein [Desulfobulbaceae bacterium]